MRVKKITIKNFSRFKELEINFDALSSRTTIFIGINGSGKTGVLEALRHSLSWCIRRLENEQGAGIPINPLSIHNGTSFASIEVEAEDSNIRESLAWTIGKARHGRTRGYRTDLAGVKIFANHYSQIEWANTDRSMPLFDLNSPKETPVTGLPLIAYFSTERNVLDVPLRIRTPHDFEPIDGYDGAFEATADFRRFFEWFRGREDIENERLRKLAEEELERITNQDDTDAKPEVGHLANHVDPQLRAVRTAIISFLDGFRALRVKRSPLRMVVEKFGEELDVRQLSQGEKAIFALVGDISRRLAIMNPGMENPLKGHGVVLIDEIDMHLHPQWQREIVDKLEKTFPNLQFILTTHSPLVISDPKKANVYSLDNGELAHVDNLYGLDANIVLSREMGVPVRAKEVEDKLDEISALIRVNDFEEAEEQINALGEQLPDDHIEITKLRLILKRQRLRHAKD